MPTRTTFTLDPVTESIPDPSLATTCTVDGCSSPTHCGSKCLLHYTQYEATGKIHIKRRAGTLFPSPEAQFLSYIITEPGQHGEHNQCWIWAGPRDGRGRPILYHQRRGLSAKRSSWMLYRGNSPVPSRIKSTCSNPDCVCPHHLAPWRAQTPPEKEDSHRLPLRTRERIWEMHWAEDIPTKSLAEIFGVSLRTIQRIINEDH